MFKTLTKLWLSLVALGVTAGCQDDPFFDVSWPQKLAEVISCENYVGHAINAERDDVDVQGILTNNVWNYKAADSAWSQCLLKREHNGVTQYGWAWAWPPKPDTIFAQPQIKVGASPWAPSPSMLDAFPAQIDGIEKLSLAYDVDIESTGNFNLATTMWLTREAVVGDEPKPHLITTEVMVWPFATPGQIRPGGQRLDIITVGNKHWEVWYQKNWGDVSGENPNSWSYLAFKSKQESLSGEIDLLNLLNYAVERQLIDPSHFVADLELGNEVMSGQGRTWVNKFKVTIEAP